MANKKRDEFSFEWEETYQTKLDHLDEISKERLSWLASFNFGDEGDGEGEPSSSSGAGDVAGMTAGSTNREKVWNFFAGKGFSQAGAAAVIGNLMQESQIKTTAVNPASGATGICQWLGGRLTGLRNHAKKLGKSWEDIDVQLDWLWIELNGGDSTTKSKLDKIYGGIDKALKKATDVRAAVIAFEDSFERAGANEKHYDTRTRYANDALSEFGSGSAGSAASTTVGSGNGGGGNLPGGLKAAKLVNGKVIPPSGRAYSPTIAKGRRSAGFSDYKTLESSKYYSNLSGCTMMVAPEFKPFVDLIHENFRARNLLKNGKIAINSAFRIKSPETGGFDNNAHGWGGAIDIGAFGIRDALAKADLCWALGFRNVQVGGSLNSGGGFIHVDIAPDLGGWKYNPWPVYRGPSSWTAYR